MFTQRGREGRRYVKSEVVVSKTKFRSTLLSLLFGLWLRKKIRNKAPSSDFTTLKAAAKFVSYK